MNIRTYESKYEDMVSIVMESDCLKLIFLPESGGKLQSIFDKETIKSTCINRTRIHISAQRTISNTPQAISAVSMIG